MQAKHAPVAQLDRASDYESEGRTFESFRARHSLPRLRVPLRRRPLRRDPPRRSQRRTRPGEKFIGFVEQPLRRAPEGEVDRAAALLVVERRKSLRLLEQRAI